MKTSISVLFASLLVVFTACSSGDDEFERTVPGGGRKSAVPVGNLPGDSLYTEANGWYDRCSTLSGMMDLFLGQDFSFVDSQGLYTINRNDTATWPLSSIGEMFPERFGSEALDDSTLVYNSASDLLIRKGTLWFFKTHITLHTSDSIARKLIRVGAFTDTLEVRAKYASNDGLWSPLVYWVKYNGLLVWDVVSRGTLNISLQRKESGKVVLFDNKFVEFD